MKTATTKTPTNASRVKAALKANVVKITFTSRRDAHGRRAHCTILKLNENVKAGHITTTTYQQKAQALLRSINDWQKRQHYENLCLLPIEWQ